MENGNRELMGDDEEWENAKCSLIVAIMKSETNIGFEFLIGNAPDVVSNQAILFPALMPYQYSDIERELTEDNLMKIFKMYFEELGIGVSPDIMEVFYYG